MGNATGGNGTGSFGGASGGGAGGAMAGAGTASQGFGARPEPDHRHRLATLRWRVPDGNWLLRWRLRRCVRLALGPARRALGRKVTLRAVAELRDRRGPSSLLTVRLVVVARDVSGLHQAEATRAYAEAFEAAMRLRGLSAQREA